MKFNTRKRALILSAALALGSAGLVSQVPALAADRDRDEWVKYDDTPRAVRQTIDQQRGRNEVKRIDHVTRDGREFYRVTIDTRGSTDAIVRIDRDGRVLDSSSIKDSVSRADNRERDRDNEKQVKFADLPRDVKETLEQERGRHDLKAVYRVDRDGRTFYRAFIDERGNDRMVRISEAGKVLGEKDVPNDTYDYRDSARTASGVSRGAADDRDYDRIDFDRLPGEVKAAIGREAGSARVGRVVKYNSGRQTIYRAETTNGDRSSYIYVNENGRVVREADATPEGRHSVNFRDLPGSVKDGISREVSGDRIDRITQVTRDGRTFYRVDSRGSDDPIYVDDNGRVLRERDFRR